MSFPSSTAWLVGLSLIFLAALGAPTPLQAAPPDNTTPPPEAGAALDARRLRDVHAWMRRLDFRAFLAGTAAPRRPDDGTLQASASNCSIGIDAPITCRRVRWRQGSGRAVAEAIRFEGTDANGWTARGLTVAVDQGAFVLAARRWRANADGTSRLEGVRVVDVSGRAVAASNLELTPNRLTFKEARFGDFELQTSGNSDVPALFSAVASAAPKAIPTRVTARAKTAEYRDGRWHLKRARARAFGGLPLSGLDGEQPVASSGFLPPEFVYVGDGPVAVRQSYLLGRWGIGPVADIAPRRWYGGGLQVVSASGTSFASPFDDSADRLVADLRWDVQNDSLGWQVVGRARRGTPLTHAAVDLEEVARDVYWQADALRRGAPFVRPWRMSRAGTSLSGESWSLQADLTHGSPAALQAPGADLAGETLTANLRYGSRHYPTGWLRTDLRLHHGSRVVREGADRHGTALFAAAALDVDAPGRVQGNVGVGSSVGTEIGPFVGQGGGEDVTGLDATTHAQAFGFGHLEVNLAGRFEHAVHHIRPRVGFIGELAGSTAEVGPTPRPAAPYVPVDDWTAITGVLDQRIDADGWQLSIPIGVVLNGMGIVGAFEAWRPFVRANLEGARWHLGASGSRHPLGDLEWEARAGASFEVIDASYAVTNASTTGLVEMAAASFIDSPAQAARLLQPSAGRRLGPDGIVQRLGIALGTRPLTVDARAFVRGDFASGGLSLEVARRLEGMGLALRAGTALTLGPLRWGLKVGFRPL